MPTREHVIREIRRVAAKIGRPPGQKVFQAETGIRKPEWYGIHFARWADALKEAGYEPNALRSRLSSGYVLRKYAEAVREFGRVPTLIEIRMYTRSRPDFPGHSTFSNHFGSKRELVAALAKMVRQDDQFADLADLLPDAAEDTSANRPSEGLLYLIRSGPHYKIGRSNQLERRAKAADNALPEPPEVVHIIRTDDASGIEAYWHRRFAAQRVKGKWFRLAGTDVRAFKRRGFQ